LLPRKSSWEAHGKHGDGAGKRRDLHGAPECRRGYVPRRFPPPWSVEELQACFVAKDSAGQKLAYVYFENERAGFNK
jgi:hypothetical protein